MIVVSHTSHTLALIHNHNVSFSCIPMQYEPVPQTPPQMSTGTLTTSTSAGVTPDDTNPVIDPAVLASETADATDNDNDEESSSEDTKSDEDESPTRDSPPGDDDAEADPPEGAPPNDKPVEVKDATTEGTPTCPDEGGQPTGTPNPEPSPAPTGARANVEVSKGTSSKKPSKRGGRSHIPKKAAPAPMNSPDVLVAAFAAPTPAASDGQAKQKSQPPPYVMTKTNPNGVNVSFPAKAFKQATNYPMFAYANGNKWRRVTKHEEKSCTKYCILPSYTTKGIKSFETRWPSVLCDIFNTCVRHLTGECHFEDRCWKLHHEPGNLVSCLPGNRQVVNVGQVSEKYRAMRDVARLLDTTNAGYQRRLKAAQDEQDRATESAAALAAQMKVLKDRKSARSNSAPQPTPLLAAPANVHRPPALEATHSVEEVPSTPERNRGTKREREGERVPLTSEESDVDSYAGDQMLRPPRLPNAEDMAVWSQQYLDDFHDALERCRGMLSDEYAFRDHIRQRRENERAARRRASRQSRQSRHSYEPDDRRPTYASAPQRSRTDPVKTEEYNDAPVRRHRAPRMDVNNAPMQRGPPQRGPPQRGPPPHSLEYPTEGLSRREPVFDRY